MPLQDAGTGAGILNLRRGPLPLPVPLVTVVGAPLRLPPFEGDLRSAAGRAHVDACHATYCKALQVWWAGRVGRGSRTDLEAVLGSHNAARPSLAVILARPTLLLLLARSCTMLTKTNTRRTACGTCALWSDNAPVSTQRAPTPSAQPRALPSTAAATSHPQPPTPSHRAIRAMRTYTHKPPSCPLHRPLVPLAPPRLGADVMTERCFVFVALLFFPLARRTTCTSPLAK